MRSEESADTFLQIRLLETNGARLAEDWYRNEVTFDEAWQYNTTSRFLPFTGDVNPYYQEEG